MGDDSGEEHGYKLTGKHGWKIFWGYTPLHKKPLIIYTGKQHNVFITLLFPLTRLHHFRALWPILAIICKRLQLGSVYLTHTLGMGK